MDDAGFKRRNKMVKSVSEQAVQLGFYFADNGSEVFRVFGEVDVIYFYNEVPPFVGGYPGFIAFIEASQVIQPDRIFVFASAFLNIVYQCRNGSAEVNKQVWRFNGLA